MLKRKWIIDNRGCLVGIWKNCREPDAAVVHFHQKPHRPPAARPFDRAAGAVAGTGSIAFPASLLSSQR
jgi:hypothetical protein